MALPVARPHGASDCSALAGPHVHVPCLFLEPRRAEIRG